jgi:hypothetical protein
MADAAIITYVNSRHDCIDPLNSEINICQNGEHMRAFGTANGQVSRSVPSVRGGTTRDRSPRLHSLVIISKLAHIERPRSRRSRSLPTLAQAIPPWSMANMIL